MPLEGSAAVRSEDLFGKDSTLGKSDRVAISKVPQNGFSSSGTGSRATSMDAKPFDSGDLASLRQLPFSSAYDDEDTSGHSWKYAIAVVVIVGLLSALAYLQWGNTIRAALGLPPQSSHTVAPLHTSQTPPNVSDGSVSNDPATQAAVPAEKARRAVQPTSQPQPSAPSSRPVSGDTSTNANQTPSVGDNGATQAVPSSRGASSQETLSRGTGDRTTPQSPTSNGITSAANATHLAPASSAAMTVPADKGQQELSIAQNYLNGTPGTRNPAIAAQWLWKAVSKQNATALVLLSNLYLQGEGVAKNCTQARLLLVAAAKKGEATAGPKLHDLENNGCR